MTKITFSFLAYGNEHIEECNILIEGLSRYKNELNFVVGTDSPDKIHTDATKIVKITDEFNFNLKRYPIKSALECSDIVLAMDTDIFIINKTIDFSILNDIDDGIYVRWMDREADFMNEKITINGNGKSSVNNEYLKKLHQLNNTSKDLFFVDECILLIKITEPKKKEEFIKNWNDIFNETLYTQPNNGIPGAMEGLIIYLSCLKSGIDVHNVRNNKRLYDFFDNFHHYTLERNYRNILTSGKKKMI